MIDFINNISLMHKNWRPSQTWEFELLKNEEKDKLLNTKYPPTAKEQDYAKQYGKTVIKTIDYLDQQSIDKSTDAMIAISSLMSAPLLLSPIIGGIAGHLFSKTNKALKDKTKLTIFNGSMIGAGVFIIANDFIHAQLEKMATRIARYQSRNGDLKAPSNFIVYTSEQEKRMNADENELLGMTRTDSKLKVSKTYKNAFKTLDEMKKDYKNYQFWKKDFHSNEIKNKENLKNINFTPEELEKAQKDRNKIINSIYKLELASNNEEINFQYAVDMILYGAKMLGAASAVLLCCLIPQKTSQINETKGIGKFMKLGIPVVVPVFSMLASTTLMQFQKDSAKLGRYEKKKELLLSENSFITYNDKQRSEIELTNYKNTNTNFITQVINDIKSIKTMPNRLEEMYSHKMNTKIQNPENMNITETQKQDAELLQKQLFYAFEKVDEKSEGFSDDIDAVLHATKQGIGTALNIAFNIYSINLLTKKLKNYNGDKMPGFFEGLKLMKHLNKKDMLAIFILPYVIKSTLCAVLDTISAQYRKKANKVGIMTAINELKDERVFTKEYLKNVV